MTPTSDLPARDPRRNPKPGDELSKTKGRRCSCRKVVAPHDGLIRYRELGVQDYDKWGFISLNSWRRWAKDAEVLHVADVPKSEQESE